MLVTLNTENVRIERQKKSSFTAHIKGLAIINNASACISNKLKFQFDNFFQQDNNTLKKNYLNEKRGSKQFQFLKQRCKATAKLVQGKSKNKKQIQAVSNRSTFRLQQFGAKSNNPQAYQNKINSQQKNLHHNIKPAPHQFILQKQSIHTTKDNSRQKSRAKSVESSGKICCNWVKKQDNFVLVVKQDNSQWKQVELNKRRKQKKVKINRITSPQISKITRVIILDWLFQLSAEIQLPKQSLYNAIDYLDKYVGLVQVCKKQYQAVSLSCLFLATKLQTSSHPRIHTFLQAMDNQINRQVLVQNQRRIVKQLKFKLNPPTLYQYMMLVLFTVKSYKLLYKNISWVNDLPQIQKGDALYRRLSWVLDGVIMQGSLTNKFQKEQICLAILYCVILDQTVQNRAHKIGTPHQKSQNKTSKIARFQSTRSSEYSMTCSKQQIQSQSHDKNSSKQKFDISFECFISYATTSNRSLVQLSACLQGLNKWTQHQCTCQQFGADYHEQFKQIALAK